MNWHRIIVHHSAGKDNPGLDFDNIRNMHININNWQDIGYHFLIEKADNMVIVVQGRPLNMSGAHTKGYNSTSIGVCMVGNFEVTKPDSNMIEALVERVLIPCCEIYKIPSDMIFGHRDYGNTLCPGKNLYNRMDIIRNMVQAETNH